MFATQQPWGGMPKRLLQSEVLLYLHRAQTTLTHHTIYMLSQPCLVRVCVCGCLTCSALHLILLSAGKACLRRTTVSRKEPEQTNRKLNALLIRAEEFLSMGQSFRSPSVKRYRWPPRTASKHVESDPMVANGPPSFSVEALPSLPLCQDSRRRVRSR